MLQDEADEEVTREVVHEAVGGDSKVEFVKYSRGLQEGHLRYTTADAAKEAVEALGEARELQIGGKAAVMTLLEGDEEAAYWEAVRAAPPPPPPPNCRARVDVAEPDGSRQIAHAGGGIMLCCIWDWNVVMATP